MASMCMVEMNSSTTNLVKEDIPLLQKSQESNIVNRYAYRPNNRRYSSSRIKISNVYKCCGWLWRRCRREKELQSRTIVIGKQSAEKYPPNVIRNQKYSILTFLPLVLYEQFKFFLNLYFLVMALSQVVPYLRLGYLYTYWGPLIFVLTVTLFREAVDDFRRHQRDEEVNCQKYTKIFKTRDHTISSELVASSKLKVGDVIMVEKDQRVPADLVLIRTTETSGCFVRTDQLDGETDWKFRLAVAATQKLDSDDNLFDHHSTIFAEKPQRDIHTFIGTFKMEGCTEQSLNLENTLWANCVVASGSALGVVVYTGAETRSVMNNFQPRSKIGLLDIEINQLTKVLFAAVIGLAFVMMCLKGFGGPWYRYMFRFVLLFSYIIPISLRVNLDMGKAFYSWTMQRDKEMPDTVVRSTTIPEELGRISYLLSDKTGTLTQNAMVFKRLHLGTVYYGHDAFDQVSQQLNVLYSVNGESGPAAMNINMSAPSGSKLRRSEHTRVHEAVKAISLCHNVTPTYDDSDSNTAPSSIINDNMSDEEFLTIIKDKEPSYQASSPDEVALVKWSELVGLSVVQRTLTKMYLKTPANQISKYTILQMFPFTPESKRMGIILKEEKTDEIVFYLKGADVVMSKIVTYTDWLEEECGNMAREGLRTLVVAKKHLTEEQYKDFETRLDAARLSMADRNARVSAEIEKLEKDMELLCVTGVEDKLQENVRQTLELLRNAGIKIWMLTGDKLETATCIAKSSRLVSRNQECYIFSPITSRTDAHLQLNNFRKKQDCALIISGDSLEICLQYYQSEFLEAACRSPAVVCCRCSPTQKAQVVTLIKEHTGKRTAAVGDGGNDVSMIQAADTGIGIAGREGKQASLAADFSIPQFSHLARLIVVHGRNSYKRSAALSQFVIHRGLIISTMQAIFSAVFYFCSVSLYQGLLMVGYATIYTMFPVFSLVLDKDVSSRIALTYPELYKELSKGRSLSFKTFFIWVLISMYQGGVIMYGALVLFEDEFIHIVAISFTALILTELIMVALTVRTWHYLIVLAEFFSLAVYILSLIIFKNYFDAKFLQTPEFLWKVLVITLVSCLPLYILKFLRKKFSPPSYSKLS